LRFTAVYDKTKISRNENLEINLAKKFCEVTPKNLEIFFLEIFGLYESEVSHRVLLRGCFFLRIFLRPGIMFVCRSVCPTF